MTVAELVMPAKAGIQAAAYAWMPAFAGMTTRTHTSGHDLFNVEQQSTSTSCCYRACATKPLTLFRATVDGDIGRVDAAPEVA